MRAKKRNCAFAGSFLEGGITVFLSLILTCICALLGGLYESARLAGCGWYLQMSLDSAVDSLLSAYHREAWERYRLFLLEYDTEEQLTAEAEGYLGDYLEEASYYPLSNRRLSVTVPIRITDQNGDYFEEEILDYMKYGVWGLEKETEKLPELLEGIQEAEHFLEIAECYQENGRKVLGLEKSLDQLGSCLKRQSEELEKGKKAIRQWNGFAFRQAASRLERELDRIPSLVENYEKEAEKLKKDLNASETLAQSHKENLKAGTWSLAVEEMDLYRSYIDEEGSRRREVREAAAQAEQNRKVVEAAIQKAEEIQEYLDSREEEDDEDDEHEEERLWKQVLTVLEGFREDHRFQNSGIRDKKKMTVLERISRLVGTDLLELCVPEGCRISQTRLDTAALPSAERCLGDGATVPLFSIGDGIRDLSSRILVTEYAAHYFSLFQPQPEAGRFQYEQEYILQGQDCDRENLKRTVNRLLAVREAINLLTILGDSGLRQEAELMALTITGAAGISPLTGVVTFFIMTVWAFAESVEELRSLLDRGTVPFFKRAAQWRVSLTGLADQGTGVFGTTFSEAEGENGLHYQDWLKLFFLIHNKIEVRYRMMDLVQENLRQEQPGFLMKQCAFRLEAEVKGEGPLIPVRRFTQQEY